MLEHSAELLPFSERIIVEFFGVDNAPKSPDWRGVATAMALADTQEQLSSGVDDVKNQEILKVRTDWASIHRKNFTQDFVNDMARSIDIDLPGYEAYVHSKSYAAPIPRLDKKEGKDLINAHDSDEVRGYYLAGILLRAQMICRDFGITPPMDEPGLFEKTVKRFGAYAKVFTAYRKSLLTTGRKPKPNDWYDLEQFLYIHDGYRFMTKEKFWTNICRSLGEDIIFNEY